MNPKIYLLSASNAADPVLIKKIEDEGYDVVITHPDNFSKEKLDELIIEARHKFTELSERELHSMQIKPSTVISPEIRKRRKRIGE